MITDKQILEKMSVMSNELANMTRELHRKNEELRRANERLVELDRLKSIFIASMSHELRTPLNSIIGFSHVLLNEWPGKLNKEQKIDQSIILRAGKHLLALINDVIDISKVEAGKLETRISRFPLQEVVNEAVAGFKEDIADKGLLLEVHGCDVEMESDRRRLLQCLINLVGNAVKFTDRGTIRITAGIKTNTERVSVAVEDTGIGIDESDIPKLFAPFGRLHAPGDNAYPGTGLGLYLTKKLVIEVLQGEINVRSVLGGGTSFTLDLPTRVKG